MSSELSWADLLDLVARVDAGAFESVSVQYGDVSVRMSRSSRLPESAAADSGPAALAAAPPPSTPAASGVSTGPASNEKPAGATITSPMVGVFYRRPSPGKPPFVEDGQSVTADTTVGIVEIMKLMNPVTAGRAGVIREFLVGDGEAVEYGQILAVFDPESS
jgi:acetyl-CoA carboxylase biotin carboxyl carrier protein